MIADAHAYQKGVDGYTDPELLSASGSIYCSSAVNRTFRGSVNSSRPKFIHMRLRYRSEAEDGILEHNAVSGVFSYKKKSSTTIPYVIVACGEYILAGRVFADYIEFKVIYKGIPQNTKKSFFVQAETILVWGDGISENLYWDGISSEMQPVSSAVDNPGDSMPTLGMMCYAHGRIFGVNPDGLVFASDHIYSKKIEETAAGVLSFNESTYPSSGDGFGSPGDLDEVTGISVMRQSQQPNGHGPVIVFCRNGAYSINAAIPRPTWTSDRNIQTIVLAGRGCGAPYSIVQLNNDIWYRCTDGSIASLRYASSDFNDAWADNAISREVSQYLEFDGSIASSFSSSLFFGNRLLMSCAFNEESGDNGQTHRYGNGFVVADFDRGSTVSRDDPLSWDGLWTGPRPTGVCKLYTDGIERAFVFSFDSDKINRVYEISTSVGNDIGPDGIEVKTKWKYRFSLSFGKDTKFALKKLDSIACFYNKASRGLDLSAYFSPRQSTAFSEMVGRDNQTPKECDGSPIGCSPVNTGVVYGHKSFKTNCDTYANPGSSKVASISTDFDFIISGEGVADIRKVLAFAIEKESVTDKTYMIDFSCENPPSDCGDAEYLFNYTIQ